mgnify:FL=1
MSLEELEKEADRLEKLGRSMTMTQANQLAEIQSAIRRIRNVRRGIFA